MNKNPFLLSIEELKKVSIDYDVSKSSVSRMNELQKYKNRYSRILIHAKYICKYFNKESI